jgi:hypothetical protein
MKDHLLTWNEVLKRDDIVGGDIQIDQDGFLLRGPISSIKIENGYVYIRVFWMARIEINRLSIGLGEGLEYCIMNFYSVSADTLPTDIGNGRMSIVKPRKGVAIIYPKGDKKLDPANVKNLKIN